MRPLHIQLTAATLLAVCAFLVMRQSGKHAPSGTHEFTARRSDGPRVAESLQNGGTGAVILSRGTHTAVPSEDTSQIMEETTPSAGVVVTPPSLSEAPATQEAKRGIQLTDDVRLPAAIMAENAPDTATRKMISPAAATANQEIANSYYRELLATAGSSPATPTPAPGGGDETTSVIPAGAAAEKARNHADEMYRALFGDDAYNRQVMNSAIEVRLPAEHP
jgi:hypothetical protein